MTKDITIESVTDVARLPELARILGRAFTEYPVARAAFGNATGTPQDWFTRMGQTALENRLTMEMPVFAAYRDSVPVGVAVVSASDRRTPPELSARFDELMAEAGPDTQAFFEEFIKVVDALSPTDPHVWLAILGVDPSAQSTGVGRQLIEATVQFARDSGTYTGVALDTEDAKNVEIYQRCGFRVVGESAVGSMPVFVMWRDLS
jgi:GNAT superfamily N-acetyltransferase